MAPRKPRISEPSDIDRAPGVPHPRQTMTLAGQDAALDIVARAVRRCRPPQAWLISGPPGVGKATLAYRIARYLFAYGASDRGPEDLSVPTSDPAAVQVAAGAHPGLLVLKRGINPDTGKVSGELKVEEVRRLNNFFGMTAGAGGWRVVIVDSADDLNENAANALLKLLEDPPAKAMALILSATPGRLLPTIRSRCQRLTLRPLGQAEMTRELQRLLPELDGAARAQLLRLAGGSPGAAVRLAGGDGLTLAKDAEALIERAAVPDVLALAGLAERVAKIADGLDMLGDFLLETLAAHIRARALAGQADMHLWVEALDRLRRSFARSGALHLDPRQTLFSAARELQNTTRRTGGV